MRDYSVSLTVMVDDEENRASAFELLCRAAQGMDPMYQHVTVSSAKHGLDDLLDGEEYFDEYTLFKVVNAMREARIDDSTAERAINNMQNAGILFREKR